MLETWVQFLGRKDPLEKEMATQSSILAWETPWTEELLGRNRTGLLLNKCWVGWWGGIPDREEDAKGRKTPKPEARGDGWEELPHSPMLEARGGVQEDQPHVQGAVAARAQEGLEAKGRRERS